VPTNYPGGTDQFHEPENPEQTSLSQTGNQPGSSNVDGRRARNHVEHHRDLGDAVQALEEHAAQKTHDHSGVGSDTTKGNRLNWANTHVGPGVGGVADTDTATTAVHHTLGTGANQAAAGNHTHDYSSPNQGGILNAPLLRCLSTARPQAPTDGLMIYETDTNRVRVWANLGRGNGQRWNILPVANIPIVRLVQQSAQNVTQAAGALIKWKKVDEVDDNFGFFNPSTTDSSKQTIRVTEPGVYQIDCAVQWEAGFIPELATVIMCVGGAETSLRFSRIQPSNLIAAIANFTQSFLNLTPDERSQTVAVSGKLRLSTDAEVTVKCRYGGSLFGGSFVNTYFDLNSKVQSRLDMHYVGP
jgi:hypothetical protein